MTTTTSSPTWRSGGELRRSSSVDSASPYPKLLGNRPGYYRSVLMVPSAYARDGADTDCLREGEWL